MLHFTDGALDSASHPFRPNIRHGGVRHQGLLVDAVLFEELLQRAGGKTEAIIGYNEAGLRKVKMICCLMKAMIFEAVADEVG